MVVGRPIINLCFRENDTFANFLFDHPKIFNIYYKGSGFEQNQINNLIQFIRAEKGKRVELEWVGKKRMKYALPSIANMYERLY